MALENAAELAAVLDRRERLGLVFARHAYGMRAWVDLFSARVASIEDPEAKALVATLVADNARHMLLFRAAGAGRRRRPRRLRRPRRGRGHLPPPRRAQRRRRAARLRRRLARPLRPAPVGLPRRGRRRGRRRHRQRARPTSPAALDQLRPHGRHRRRRGAAGRRGPRALPPPRAGGDAALRPWRLRPAASPTFAELERPLPARSRARVAVRCRARGQPRRRAAERRAADRLRARLRLRPVHGPRLRRRGHRAHRPGPGAGPPPARHAHLRRLPRHPRAWPRPPCSTRPTRWRSPSARRSSPTSPPAPRPTCCARWRPRPGSGPSRATSTRGRSRRPAAAARELGVDDRLTTLRADAFDRAALAALPRPARRGRRARALRHLPRRPPDRAPLRRPGRARRAAPDRLQRADPEPGDRAHRPGLAQRRRRRCVWRLRPVGQILGYAAAAGYGPASRPPTATASTASCAWSAAHEQRADLERRGRHRRPIASHRLREPWRSHSAMWNYVTYRDAIGIVGPRPRRALPRRHDPPARRLGRPGLARVLLPARRPAPSRRCARRSSAEALSQYSPDLVEPLRDEAARVLGRPRDDTFEVIGTEGAQAGIALSLLAAIDPGDEVILGDPGYFHLPSAVIAAGGEPVFVPAGRDSGFRIDVDAVAAAVDPAHARDLPRRPRQPLRRRPRARRARGAGRRWPSATTCCSSTTSPTARSRSTPPARGSRCRPPA